MSWENYSKLGRMVEWEVGCELQKSEAISLRTHLNRDLKEGSEQCGCLGEYSRQRAQPAQRPCG